MPEAAHQCIDGRAASGLGCVLLEPFSKRDIQSPMASTDNEPRLLDQFLTGN